MGETTKSKTIDEKLFEAWRRGDQDACHEIWALLFSRLYTRAILFCRRRVTSPEQVAADALHKAFSELSPGGTSKVQPRWQGAPQFESFFWDRLKNRCLDAARSERCLQKKVQVLESTDEDGGDDVLGELGATDPDVDLDRQSELAKALTFLTTCREICRDIDAFREIADLRVAYFRRQMIEVGKAQAPSAPCGREWDSLVNDDLVLVVDSRQVVITKSGMDEFVRRGSNLDGKDMATTYYQRKKKMKAFLGAKLGLHDDDPKALEPNGLGLSNTE